MSTATVPRYTAAEYLAFERASDQKHEFYNGEIFAMAGGTGSHSLIAINVAAELRNVLQGRCRTYGSDMRISCPSGLYTYPDLSVVCGKPQYADATQDVLLNPLAIVEVLSPSTERYDRTTKFDHYRTIPSLREYVLVSQHAPRIDHFVRQENGEEWLMTTMSDPQGVIEFPALKCTIPLAGIYATVDFEEARPPGEGNGIVVRPPQT